MLQSFFSLSVKVLQFLLPQFMLNCLKKAFAQLQLLIWHIQSRPVPPPHIVKQMIISSYQRQFHYSTLIETGTYLGDMVEAQKNNFHTIISIELSAELFKKARQRFKHDHHVTIVLGDSGQILSKILKEVQEPTIFWLDGHYSAGVTARGDKDCPIFEELQAILTSSHQLPHIILIDDARCFTGQGDYPTIKELTAYVKAKNSRYQLTIQDDVLRFII